MKRIIWMLVISSLILLSACETQDSNIRQCGRLKECDDRVIDCVDENQNRELWDEDGNLNEHPCEQVWKDCLDEFCPT